VSNVLSNCSLKYISTLYILKVQFLALFEVVLNCNFCEFNKRGFVISFPCLYLLFIESVQHTSFNEVYNIIILKVNILHQFLSYLSCVCNVNYIVYMSFAPSI